MDKTLLTGLEYYEAVGMNHNFFGYEKEIAAIIRSEAGVKSGVLGYPIIGLSLLIGGGSLIMFMVFLYMGAVHIVMLEVDAASILWLDSFLCLAFFAQHSGMIREGFRRRIERLIQPHYYGAFFSISSGMVLLVLVLLWQESEFMVADFQGVARFTLRLTFALSIVGLMWSSLSLRSFDIVGKDQIMAHIRSQQLTTMRFTVRGPYRLIRHPFYFFMLMMIWSSPEISLDRLLFNGLWSIWIVVGTVLEERDLVTNFGEVYKEYQRTVPMLIPWRIWAKTSA